MGKILVTGGAGFIGSRLSLKLIKSGYDVVVLDSLSDQIHDKTDSSSYWETKVKPEVEFIHGDVRNKNDWRKALKNVSVIYHLAAETGTGQSMYEVENYVSTNVGGTAAMLDALANIDNDVNRVILASSRAVYGEGLYWSKELGLVYPPRRSSVDLGKGRFNPIIKGYENEVLVPRPTPESAPKTPSSIYGLTKLQQEELLNMASDYLKISSVILRFQNVYGPGQSLKNAYTGILSIFSNQIRNEEKINIFEDGLESRDFVFIDDVIESLILSLNKEAQGTYNVGTGINTSVCDVVEELYHHLGQKKNYVISGNYRVGDIRHNYADISRISSHLGFVPRYSFTQGIGEFIGWVETQKKYSSNLDKSLSELKQKKLFG